MARVYRTDMWYTYVRDHTGVDHIIYHRQVLYLCSLRSTTTSITPLDTTAHEQLYSGSE